MLVLAIDEAGRGALAGPVIAGAVLVEHNFDLKGLYDSKKLSPRNRLYFALLIKQKSWAFSTGLSSAQEIDRLNIHQATLLAMERAAKPLLPFAELVLIDGLFVPKSLLGKARSIVHGDVLCPPIAAASVIAKTTRDRIMIELQQHYPDFGFYRHKGYGTPEHMAAIQKYGACPEHRQSFAPLRYA
jgi:ribonuclease HII